MVNWLNRFVRLTCDGLRPAGPILGISSSSLTIAQTSSRPMLRYSFAWPRDAIGSTIKKLGRPRPSHPLCIVRTQEVVSPDGTPRLPDHAPRKFCEAFRMIWLSLGDC